MGGKVWFALALATLAVAAPGPALAAPAEASVSLAAVPASDGIQADLQVKGVPSLPVVVAVLHDGADGPVVDRLAPLTLSAAQATRALLLGLPPRADLTVRVLDGPLSAYQDGQGGVAGAKVHAAASLAPDVVVPARGATDPLPHQTLAARRVANESGGDIRLLDLGNGRVAVAWMTWSEGEFSGLHLALSQDGGRTFAAPLALSARINPDRAEWSWAQDADGSLVVVVSEWDGERSAPVARAASTLLRVDPDTQEVARRDLAPGLRLPGPSDLALDGRGRLLLATMGGGATGDPYLATPRLWNLTADQPATLLHTFDGHEGSSYYSAVDLEVSGDHALLMWDVYDPHVPDPSVSIQLSRSSDGGLTFGPAWTPALGSLRAQPQGHLELDEAGTAHLALLATPTMTMSGGWTRYDNNNATGLYMRLPAGQSVPTVTALNGPHNASRPTPVFPGSVAAHGAALAVDGAHVWVLLEDYRSYTPTTGHVQTIWAASSDGGRTFAPPIRPANRQGFGVFVDDVWAIRGNAVLANQGVEATDSGIRHVVSAPLLAGDPLPTEGQLLQVWSTGDPAPQPSGGGGWIEGSSTYTGSPSHGTPVPYGTSAPRPHPAANRSAATPSPEPEVWTVTPTPRVPPGGGDEGVVEVPAVGAAAVLGVLAALAVARRRLR